ncbi:MAG TPA: hypothetical protein VK899_04845 [Gemmatimonadales bacterium]|nr:hypothetical protein [Gemmatimonadales bacterium]
MTDEMTMEQATERVARGMAWIMENAETLDLDLNRVDLSTVNVVNDHDCVLAQASGRSFWAVLDGVDMPVTQGENWTVYHGFATPAYGTLPDRDVIDQQAATLAAAWRTVITAQRSAS